MEFRGQEKELKPVLGFSQFAYQDRERSTNNENGSTTPPTLFSQGPDRIAITESTPIGPTLGRSNSKTTSPSPSIRYRECLKNHAANIGGNILDGCGEFMPTGEEGTLEALKCAACECHRNFHRKEISGAGETNFRRSSSMFQLPPPLHHHNKFSTVIVPPVHVAPPYGNNNHHTESSSEDLAGGGEMGAAAGTVVPPFMSMKKRFRTKFSQEQKEKMMEFAEKVGWRLQKQDDEEVQRFCGEIGVKRQVFKVWMHNNKNSSTKKEQQQPE